MEEEEMKKAGTAAQQGQNHTMLEGQNHTMSEGQNHTMFEGQNHTVFEGQNCTMFEGQNHTMFKGQNHTTFQGLSHLPCPKIIPHQFFFFFLYMCRWSQTYCIYRPIHIFVKILRCNIVVWFGISP